jgi:hypothetical protein
MQGAVIGTRQREGVAGLQSCSVVSMAQGGVPCSPCVAGGRPLAGAACVGSDSFRQPALALQPWPGRSASRPVCSKAFAELQPNRKHRH